MSAPRTEPATACAQVGEIDAFAPGFKYEFGTKDKTGLERLSRMTCYRVWTRFLP
jgi:hypothetical protein